MCHKITTITKSLSWALRAPYEFIAPFVANFLEFVLCGVHVLCCEKLFPEFSVNNASLRKISYSRKFNIAPADCRGRSSAPFRIFPVRRCPAPLPLPAAANPPHRYSLLIPR
jgi:hypothetical protein